MVTAPTVDEQVEDLLREGRALRAEPAPARERAVELVAAATFLAGAVALELAAPSPVRFDAVLAGVLVVTYAAATRVRFEFARWVTDPSLLVLVPMLFLLPAHVVPLLVVTGFLLGRSPDYRSGRLHPDRMIAAFGDSIHALGPALVIATATDGGPRGEDWPWFVLALLAFVAGDLASGFARAWAAHGIRPQLSLRLPAEVYALDVLLAPVGLMAAFASASFDYAFLLGAPLVLLLSGFAREREGRLTNALELSQERTRVLEAELAASRVRAEVLGTVSHGLQTPLAGVVGLVAVLEERGETLRPERRRELATALGTHARKLRHLVRQTLDIGTLQAGEPLHVSRITVALEPLVREVVTRVPEGRARVGAQLDEHARHVLADPARVEQVLTVLVDNACRWGRGDGTVRLSARREGDRVRLAVADDGPGVPATARGTIFDAPAGSRAADESQGAGLGLHVAHAAVAAMGGELRLLDDGPGATFAFTLPAPDASGSSS